MLKTKLNKINLNIYVQTIKNIAYIKINKINIKQE